MGLDDEKFEQVMQGELGRGPLPAHLHPGPHRVYPHEDADALGEEIAEVFAFRREGNYLP